MLQSFFLDDDGLTGSWFDYDGSLNTVASNFETTIAQAGVSYGVDHIADCTHIVGNPYAVLGDSGRFITVHKDMSGNLILGNTLTVPKVDPTPPPGGSLLASDWVATPPHLRRDGSEYSCVWGSWQRLGSLPAIGNRRGVVWIQDISVSAGGITVTNGANELASLIIPTFSGATNANSSQIDDVMHFNVGNDDYVILVRNDDINIAGYLTRYFLVDNLRNDALRNVRLSGTNPPEWNTMFPGGATHVTVGRVEEFLTNTILAQLRPLDAALNNVGNPQLCVGLVTLGGIHGKYLNAAANSYDLVTALGSLALANTCAFKKLNNAGDILICSYNKIQVVNYSAGVFTLVQDFPLSSAFTGSAFIEGAILQVRPDEWVYNAAIFGGPNIRRSWTVVMQFSGNTITSVSQHFGNEYIPGQTNDAGSDAGNLMCLGDAGPDSMISIYGAGGGLVPIGGRTVIRA